MKFEEELLIRLYEITRIVVTAIIAQMCPVCK